MNEKRLIGYIGVYGCLILAKLSNNDLGAFFFLGMSIIWLITIFINKEK